MLSASLLTALGLSFLACGLIVYYRVDGTASTLFAAYCLCAALHWGGPLEIAAGSWRTGLIFFYLLASGVLGETLFLQLALAFPKRSRLLDGRLSLLVLYAPLSAGTIAMAVLLASPTGSGVRETAQSTLMLLHGVVTNLFAVLALALFTYRLARAEPRGPERRFVGLMVAGLLVAWLPYLIASSLGGDTDLWNLTMIALPVSFTISFLGMSDSRRTGGRAAKGARADD